MRSWNTDIICTYLHALYIHIIWLQLAWVKLTKLVIFIFLEGSAASCPSGASPSPTGNVDSKARGGRNRCISLGRLGRIGNDSFMFLAPNKPRRRCFQLKSPSTPTTCFLRIYLNHVWDPWYVLHAFHCCPRTLTFMPEFDFESKYPGILRFIPCKRANPCLLS